MDKWRQFTWLESKAYIAMFNSSFIITKALDGSIEK